MKKDFDIWNDRKKKLDAKDLGELYFDEREIWWVYTGINVGFEENGKGVLFLRPFLILKKFNKHLMYAVPLTTQIKTNPYYVPCVASDEVPRMAIVSQMKSLSSKRLYRRIGFVATEESEKIKNAVKSSLGSISSPVISGADFSATEPEGHLYIDDIPHTEAVNTDVFSYDISKNMS